MSSTPVGKHAGPGPAGNQPAAPETTYADRARTLLFLNRMGTLSTHSRKQPGYPFGSVMPYGLDESGRPTFLISTMAMHTQNLQADPRASLLVAQADGGDPLGAARVTLVGNVARIPENEVAAARKLYLEHYPNSRNWVDSEDFGFFRMEVVDVYFVGGFGVMGWVSASEYSAGHSDPLAESGPRIIQHMNNDHAVALKLLAQKFVGMEAEEAVMTSIDRLGFYLRLKMAEGPRGVRIAFIREVSGADEARNVLIEMVDAARKK
jgi:heme iron utilization protein